MVDPVAKESFNRALAGFIETTANEPGFEESLWTTLGVSDGKVVHAVRYASNGQAPTLYHSRDVEDAGLWNPQLAGRFSSDTRFIVSEPAGTVVNVWVEVPQGSYVRVEGEALEIRPFAPVFDGRSA